MAIPLRVPAGSRLKWLMDHVGHSGDGCLPWPFSLVDDGRYGQLTVNGRLVGAHRYMCIQAHGEPQSANMLARHKCLNKNACVNPKHLEWGTGAQNQMDRVRDGTDNRGVKGTKAKINETQAREIKSMLSQGIRCLEIANKYGISDRAVYKIRDGQNWAWL